MGGSMKDFTDLLIYICLIIAFFLATVLTGMVCYKQGQVDALNGDVRYELVQQTDKTIKWTLIPKGE